MERPSVPGLPFRPAYESARSILLINRRGFQAASSLTAKTYHNGTSVGVSN